MKYKVRYYESTYFSLFTQADHFGEAIFTSNKNIEEFAKQLAEHGFGFKGDKKWIMPGAITEIVLVEE